MRVQRFAAQNYRNLQHVELPELRRFNLIHGDNGQGKSNLLDALHTLITGKSYLYKQESDNIQSGAEYYVLSGLLESKERVMETRIVLPLGKRKLIKHAGDEATRLRNYYGNYNCVMIAPQDLILITGTSEYRRRWLDAILSSTDNKYLNHLLLYNRMVTQRNAYLKKYGIQLKENDVYLKTVVEQVAPAAAYLYESRKAAITEMKPYLRTSYVKISNAAEEARLMYTTQLDAAPLTELWAKGWKKDTLLGRTTAGIHKDDLELELEEYPVKRYGSQGQQKSYLLAMKLAEYQYLKQAHKNSPVLMLDDICDRLDEHRLRQLFYWIEEEAIEQAFITDVSQSRTAAFLPGGDVTKTFRLCAGALA